MYDDINIIMKQLTIIHKMLQVIGRGVFRGTGKQKWGTYIIFFSYYIVALPVALPLALLTPLKLKGLWLGWLLATCICALIYFIVINFGLNWEKLENEVSLYYMSFTVHYIFKLGQRPNNCSQFASGVTWIQTMLYHEDLLQPDKQDAAFK